jgi:3-phenylpropionate/trans-cinnamate dioxygenase ferredoxin reductase subunit
MTETPNEHVICVGAGQASLSCAAKLRALGWKAAITIIGEEPYLPYQRPPLSKKYLTGEMPAERLLLRPPEWYAEQNVTCLCSQRVSAIDRVAKTVSLASGGKLRYSWLVLATGSTPRQLPHSVAGSLGNIHAVRNIADIDALAKHFRKDARLVVIGGGYIGLEAASVAAKAGMRVVIVEVAQRILERVACRETSAYFDALHRSHGVEIVTNARLEKLRGENGVVGEVVLADGRIMACDVVIVGIGILPTTELAVKEGLSVDNGIIVDAFCRTSDPDVLAVGDCANFPYHNGRLRLESVPHAIAQGEAAALTIAGQSQPYVAKPWFWSDQYDVKLQIAGLNQGYDETVSRGPDANGGYSVWYYKEGTLLAVDAMNSASAYMVGKRLIEAGQSIPPERARNPAEDMKSWLKA